MYVKLTTLPDQWFLAGTEAFDYEHPRRMTLEEFSEWMDGKNSSILASGVHMGDDGVARWDGEYCCMSEFSYEFVNEDGTEEYKELEHRTDILNEQFEKVNKI